MKAFILDYICKLEGYKTAIKSLHWNSSSLEQHKLCDDIADIISEFQDQVSEVEQSISGKLPFNKLKGINYKISNLKKFVEDVISETNKFYKKIKTQGDKYVGMASDCESFLSDIQRQLYLVKFTMKENKKRLHSLISESIRKSLNELSLDTIKSAWKESYPLSHTNDSVLYYKYGSIDIGTLYDMLFHYESKGNNQAFEYILYLDKILSFVDRKTNQAENFEDTAEDLESQYEDQIKKQET